MTFYICLSSLNSDVEIKRCICCQSHYDFI